MKVFTAFTFTFAFIIICCSIISANSQCAPTGTPRDELARSDSVFSGRVVEFEIKDNSEVHIIFCVDNIWKGPKGSKYRIRTCPRSNCCGFNFEVGKTYMVYSYTFFDKFWTSTCTRTAEILDGQSDINLLPTPEYTFDSATCQ